MVTKTDETGKFPTAGKRFHAVSIKPGTGACSAASAAASERWLSREAPQLPLVGCTSPESCRCTYQHHEDRRVGGRRAEDTDVFRRPALARIERRNRRDRRK